MTSRPRASPKVNNRGCQVQKGTLDGSQRKVQKGRAQGQLGNGNGNRENDIKSTFNCVYLALLATAIYY